MTINRQNKETKVATLCMKREKFIPDCHGCLFGKPGKMTGEKFLGLNGSRRKEICELGGVPEHGLRKPRGWH